MNRAWLLSALLAAAAPPAPARAGGDGEPVRLDIGPETASHRYDRESGEILYIQGGRLSKSHFCAYALAGGKTRCWNHPNHRILDYAYSARHGKAVLLARRQREYLSNSTDAELSDDRLLVLSLPDGKVLGEVNFPRGTSGVALGLPRWSERAFAVLVAQETVVLKAVDLRTGEAAESRTIAPLTAEKTAFPDDAPVAVIEGRDPGRRPRLLLYDLKDGKLLRDIPRDSGLDLLWSGDGGVLAAFRPPAELKTTIARIDLESGELRPVASLESGAESVIEAGGAVLAISKDPARRSPTNDRGFHPRLLTRFTPGGPTGGASHPWTRRFGRFFGYDDKAGLLFFHATEPSGVWSLPAAGEALPAAGAALDGDSLLSAMGPMEWAGAASALVILIAGGLFIGRGKPCPSCPPS